MKGREREREKGGEGTRQQGVSGRMKAFSPERKQKRVMECE